MLLPNVRRRSLAERAPTRRLLAGHKADRMFAVETAVRRKRSAYLGKLITRAVRSLTSDFMAIVRRLWRPQDTAEQYLAAATDLADLERRIRALERERGASVVVTFNH